MIDIDYAVRSFDRQRHDVITQISKDMGYDTDFMDDDAVDCMVDDYFSKRRIS